MSNRKLFVKLGIGILLTIALVGGYLALGVSRQSFIKPACSCGSVNMEVVMHLNHFEHLVQQYATEHNGKFPTYNELFAIAAEEKLERHLTSQISLKGGTFTFNPTRGPASTIGYAVSNDRRSYILLGIGLTVKFETLFLYGREIWTEEIGYEYPILRPGDTPPEPSPFQ